MSKSGRELRGNHASDHKEPHAKKHSNKDNKGFEASDLQTKLTEIDQKSQAVVERVKKALDKMPLDRVVPEMLDSVEVVINKEGAKRRVPAVASVKKGYDNRTLNIIPFDQHDKAMLGFIADSLRKSPIHPATVQIQVGEVIMQLSENSEERKYELNRMMHQEGEAAKVELRNLRQTYRNKISQWTSSKDEQERFKQGIEKAFKNWEQKVVALLDENAKKLGLQQYEKR